MHHRHDVSVPSVLRTSRIGKSEPGKGKHDGCVCDIFSNGTLSTTMLSLSSSVLQYASKSVKSISLLSPRIVSSVSRRTFISKITTRSSWEWTTRYLESTTASLSTTSTTSTTTAEFSQLPSALMNSQQQTKRFLSTTSSTTEDGGTEQEPRETMPFDVLIVGGGPAGLAASIRIKQLSQEAGKDLSVCLIDKGRYVCKQ